MAYFEDLSDYAYAPGFVRPGTKAVGWLSRGHVFPTKTLDEDLLDVLWKYCSISVVQTRGFHNCEFCPMGTARHFERNNQRLSLGTSEIRVFSQNGNIYAAPTLIYHYVQMHQYKPPDEFLQALREGFGPPNQEYFDALAKLNLEWNKTSKGAPRDRVLLNPCADEDRRNYLEQIGTLLAIEQAGLKLKEGLIAYFYHPDRSGNENYMLFEGAIHHDSEKGKWYTIIDQNSYRPEV